MTPEIWAEIRRLHLVEKLSLREIALQLDLDRKTVRRALRHDHAPPPPVRLRASLLDLFEKDIEELLAATPRLTAVRLHEELQRRGFQGKYTIVKKRLSKVRQSRQRDAYIRRAFHAGEAGEVDWAYCGPFDVGGQTGTRRSRSGWPPSSSSRASPSRKRNPKQGPWPWTPW